MQFLPIAPFNHPNTNLFVATLTYIEASVEGTENLFAPVSVHDYERKKDQQKK